MTTQPNPTQNEQTTILDEIVSILYVLGIVFVVRLLAFDPFFIPSSSMYPTLKIGDMPVVHKWEYGYSKYAVPFIPVDLPITGRIGAGGEHFGVKRGDVVVFRYPQDTSVNYIKRAIGLPGDTVQMKQGRLYINGTMVQRKLVGDYTYTDMGGMQVTGQEYIETLPNGVQHRILEAGGDNSNGDNTPVFTVPDGHYFMMGDNRDMSLDSRFYHVGYVPAVNLIGPAQYLMWSYDSVNSNIWQVQDWLFSIRYSRIFMNFTQNFTK